MDIEIEKWVDKFKDVSESDIILLLEEYKTSILIAHSVTYIKNVLNQQFVNEVRKNGKRKTEMKDIITAIDVIEKCDKNLNFKLK